MSRPPVARAELSVLTLSVPRREVLLVGDLAWPRVGKPILNLASADISQCLLVPNLEGSLAIGRQELHLSSGRFCGLSNGEGVLSFFEELGVRVVGGANNHITDYGHMCRRTAEILEERGILLAGVGASRPLAARGCRVLTEDGVGCVLLFSGDPRVSCSKPTRSDWGVHLYSLRREVERVRLARSSFPRDVLLPVIHWGEEYETLPSPEMRHHSAAMLDAGADAVVGHHPHVWQGCEVIAGKHVVYSMGNFLMADGGFDGFAPPTASKTRVGVAVRVSATGLSLMGLRSDPATGQVDEIPLDDLQRDYPMPFCEEWPVSRDEYWAMYRRSRHTRAWYPKWSGREGRSGHLGKTVWLRCVNSARRLTKRRRRGCP